MFYLTIVFGAWIYYASAQSQGDVRLAGQGANNLQGRLEVFNDNQWGTVCIDAFSNVDASIVCIQLGFPQDTASVITNTFGPGVGPIWLDDVACTGTETKLEQCPHGGWGQHNCDHSEDVAVRCRRSAVAPTAPVIPTTTKSPNVVQDSNCTVPDSRIRIIGPANLPGTGVVQVFSNNMWGGVCDNDWDLNDARAVCRSLCHDPSKALPGSIAFDTSNITEPMTIASMNCDGTETSVVDCPQSAWVAAGGACKQSEKARVTCEEMDNSAPARPEADVQCTNGRISASFSKITDPYLKQRHISVDVSYTGVCNEEKTNTTDFVTISVPFDECGTEATSNSTHIIYKTRIRYDPTHISGSISHSNTYIFKIQCELPRTIDSGNPILPISETITQTAPGEFVVGLSFFKDPAFKIPEQNFPLEVPLGEMLGSTVQLSDVDENLRLVVPECIATPTNARHHSTNYSLFSEKCIDDDTVGFFPMSDTVFGFRYRTFKFRQYPEVHIHCKALVCRKEDTDPECDRSCLATTVATTAGTTAASSSGRRRRSVNHDIIEVSSPALIVYNPNDDGSIIIRGDETTRRPTEIAATSDATQLPEATSVKTTLKSEQTIRPPFVGDIESVITGDGSGAGAILSNNFCMCLLILAVVFM